MLKLIIKYELYILEEYPYQANFAR